MSSGDLLTGYHDAVHEQTIRLVSGVTDADLSRVVDEAWDPPVTLGVRLVSVISDGLQHAGQAAFIRGILLRARALRPDQSTSPRGLALRLAWGSHRQPSWPASS